MVDPEHLRSIIRAEPFRRFTLVMNDGKRYEFKRPLMVGMTPDGKSLFFGSSVDGQLSMPVSCVKEVVVEPPPSEDLTKTLRKLRELRNADPFVPFVVIVDDGRRFVVDQPYRLSIAPSGREICYATSRMWFDRVPAQRVKEVLRERG